MVQAAEVRSDPTHLGATVKLADLVGVAPSPLKIGRNDKLLRLDQLLLEMEADTTLEIVLVHMPLLIEK
jgi:hypothetical protein